MKKIILFCLFVNFAYSQCWQSVESSLSYHCVGIQVDGTLWSWGYNADGQLGDGTIINKEVPTQIGTATNWGKPTIGLYHTVVMKQDNTMWSWGRNDDSQLGDGTATDVLTPTQISDTDWFKVDAGNFHTVSVKNDATAWSWGDNSLGQLGDGWKLKKWRLLLCHQVSPQIR